MPAKRKPAAAKRKPAAAKRKPAAAAATRDLKASYLLEQIAQTMREANRTGGEFCRTDIGAAMTMLDRAQTTRERATRERNVRNAHHAFEVVSNLVDKLSLEPAEEEPIRDGLRVLEARLREFDAAPGGDAKPPDPSSSTAPRARRGN